MLLESTLSAIAKKNLYDSTVRDYFTKVQNKNEVNDFMDFNFYRNFVRHFSTNRIKLPAIPLKQLAGLAI
jgi:hypothetical protein